MLILIVRIEFSVQFFKDKRFSFISKLRSLNEKKKLNFIPCLAHCYLSIPPENWFSGTIKRKLLNYVPHVLLCCRVSRALVPHVPACPCATYTIHFLPSSLTCLVPYMLLCLTCLVPYVLLCLMCLAPYVLSCFTCLTYLVYLMSLEPALHLLLLLVPRATHALLPLSLNCFRCFQPNKLSRLMSRNFYVLWLLYFWCFSHLTFLQPGLRLNNMPLS